MAITYPITLPLGEVAREVRFGSRSHVGLTSSPFTGEQQVFAHAGALWQLEIELKPMRRAEAEAWIAALVSLNGREGTFLFGDPVNTSPRGVGTGTPLVNGASQTGRTLVTDGWTVSQTGILKTGDWFQLGSGSTTRLHKVMADSNSDGSGNATLEIWPRLRESPADDAAIVVTNPVGQWRLAENLFDWSIGMARFYGLHLSAVEAL